MFENCADLAKYIADYQVKFINLNYVDTDGSVKCETFLTKSLNANDLANGVKFFINNNYDLLLKPDLKTGFLNPFSSQMTLVFFCNLVNSNDNIISKICSRSYLTQTSESLAQKYENFHAYVEFSFDIFEDSNMKNHDFFHDILSEILETGQAIGLEMHSCFINSKHNVIFSCTNLLKLADDLCKIKTVILNVVRSYGKKINLDFKEKWQKCFKIKFTLQKDGANFLENTECGDFLQRIIKNNKLISVFALGNEKHINYSNENNFLQKVFDRIYLNFNYINLNSNFYLALHVFFSCAMDENITIDCNKGDLNFDCFAQSSPLELLEKEKFEQNYIEKDFLMQYTEKVKSILKNNF